jgi:isoleucyl-tRNA synthetase
MSDVKKIKDVSSKMDFVEMESNILDLWNKRKILEKYLKKNKQSKKHFSFIDGPITANNPMGVHHAWGRTYKDVVQRYKNMQGFEQRFQNGFDCQGLWVEVGVEKELGFNSKKDILDYGMDKFTDTCVARVNKFANVQTEQSKRLGMFMDWDNSYYTMSESNNLYIWYFLKKCYEQGLLYTNDSATTWCPRCETGLSQHEQADGYKMIKDTSVYVLFKLVGRKNEYVLAWTTTPWTLAANVLLAVNPDLRYVKTEYEGKILYLGSDSASRLNFQNIESIDVEELIGLEYESLFDIQVQKNIKHHIVKWNLVDSTSGSGVVHIAPGCGQEDFELGKELGVEIIAPLDSTGKFVEGYGELTGKYAHNVADDVIKYLEKESLLFKTEEYEHSYPHCWRCNTKCLFRLENNWFINVQKIKGELKKEAEDVKWIPEFVGKRMQGWLDGMSDWMISRKRFYGLALPFYICEECGHMHVVGSKEELRELAVDPSLVDKLQSVHRPWIDEIKIKCLKCGNQVNRVADVGDCWLDAGVVPFSTLKYIEDREYWEKWFPADFIVEMIEQVRLWFYSMLVFGVILEKKVPYKKVMGFAELRDEKNDRMSKTKANYVKFDDAANKIGSDIIRWNFVTAPIGANMRFGWSTLEDVRRSFYLPLWNSYNYFVTYAKLHNWDPKNYEIEKVTNIMDTWIINRVRLLLLETRESMDAYNIHKASRDIESFVTDLSQWYIRRGRTRFKKGDKNALSTLHYCLVSLSKILAPMIPFVSEEIYQNLVVNLSYCNAKESVHLEEYPKINKSDLNMEVLSEMDKVREICSLGLKIRDENRIKVRQPLSKAYISISNEKMLEIIRGELNVKKVEFSEKIVKRKDILSQSTEDVFVCLDIKISKKLKEEGILNEIFRGFQVARKESGCEVGEYVNMLYMTQDNGMEDLLKKNVKKIQSEIFVKDIKKRDTLKKGRVIRVDEYELVVAIEK